MAGREWASDPERLRKEGTNAPEEQTPESAQQAAAPGDETGINASVISDGGNTEDGAAAPEAAEGTGSPADA